ncbi:MAG: hypothetical protein CMN72_14730, partial [Sphingomonas sp.]|nr:hypothetical protein [Sphingomonas sp.]
KAFRKWVTQEVLPAIRTTGRYSVANDEPDFSAPETPDQFDVLRVKLQLVREARHAFGLKGARKAWSHCGLPELMSEPEHELMPIGVLADLHRSIAEWMEARTEAVPGHREWSSDLYDDYVRWCRGQDMSASAIETQVVFGRMLTQCGVAAKRSGRVLRIGLRLVR